MQKVKLLEALDRFLEAMHRASKKKALAKTEKKLEKEMQKAFREQGRLFLEKFEKKFKARFSESTRLKESIPPEDADPVFDEVFILTSGFLQEPIRKATEDSLKKAGKKVISDIKADISFDLKNPRAVDFLEKNAANKVTMINDTTRSRIKTIITRGTEKGWSYDKMAREIKNRFEEFAVGKPQKHIESRAHLVAVTETAEAYEEGNQIAAQEIKKQGIQMEKSWLTVGDSKVSDGCQRNQDAGWIDIDESFPSGHQRPPRFPGCRCDCLYRRKPQEGE